MTHDSDSKTTVLIALGGNLGDVRETFIQARRDLDATDRIDLIASSLLYRTPPLGPEGQPDYLNAAIKIQTTLQPLQLLDQLHQIEDAHGRKRLAEQPRWGARTLDLDIIAYDALSMQSERLTLPHIHMHERMFVLCPLCDIAPNWQHPLLKVTAEQRMQQLIRDGERTLPTGEAW